MEVLIGRRQFLGALGGAAVAWPLAGRAQQAGRLPQIGFLYPGVMPMTVSRVAALREGLRAVNYGDADRVEILVRASEGDPTRLAALAADLVERKVDVIVPVSPSAVRAAKSATSVIPLIANDLESDPVRSGFVASLAHPGGNITGVFSDFPEFGMKWLELLKEAIPALSHVVVLWDSATGPIQRDAVEAAGRLLDVKLEVMEIRSITELAGVFETAGERRPDAIVILSSPIFGTNPKLIAELTLAHHIPTATLFPEIARAGSLMAYGPNLLGTFRQAGTMVGKVLQGLPPADLPVERPTKFEMVINLKTARALGVNLPTTVMLRADEVIE
jgi:putative tryptophan/tyrosine transport system substrate-binding protein